MVISSTPCINIILAFPTLPTQTFNEKRKELQFWNCWQSPGLERKEKVTSSGCLCRCEVVLSYSLHSLRHIASCKGNGSNRPSSPRWCQRGLRMPGQQTSRWESEFEAPQSDLHVRIMKKKLTPWLADAAASAICLGAPGLLMANSGVTAGEALERCFRLVRL